MCVCVCVCAFCLVLSSWVCAAYVPHVSHFKFGCNLSDVTKPLDRQPRVCCNFVLSAFDRVGGCFVLISAGSVHFVLVLFQWACAVYVPSVACSLYTCD